MDSPYLFLAMTNPAPGKEDEFNRFYDDVHCDDVIGSSGWLAVQRYRLANEHIFLEEDGVEQHDWRILFGLRYFFTLM